MKIDVQIAEGYESAHIIVKTEEGEVEPVVTPVDLIHSLSVRNVIIGIKHDVLNEICESKLFNQLKLAAECEPPGVGDAARIEILRKPKKKNEISAPRTQDNTVDYIAPREGFLVTARKGDTLAIKYPSTRGNPGKTVLGRVIPGKFGKEIDLELFKGPGTSISEDKLFSDQDGILTMDGLKLSVLDTYVIDDSIGLNTGSIDLPLDLKVKLVVKGDVQRGYWVSCNSLEVNGCVEDSKITVSTLFVKEGIVGIGKDPVIADRISAGYINGPRQVKGNMISVVREISGGAEVYGNVIQVYTIRGSTVAAKEALWSQFVNGKNVIIVGIDYQNKMLHDELSKKIHAVEDPIEELKSQGLLNTKRMKKLTELARINPKHPLLLQELPKIREAQIRLDNFLNLRAELIKKREEFALAMYSTEEPFFLVQEGFSKDKTSDAVVEPNIIITMREHNLRITEAVSGGLFTVTQYGITHTSRYNIKELKTLFETLQKNSIQKENHS